MLRSSFSRGFTLIEMLTVMLIIAILAGMILAVNGLVQNKAARARAEGEMKTLSLGCENYKTDNGGYPRSADTDALDPRVDGNPLTGAGATRYQVASKFLYIALSGDTNADGRLDTQTEGKPYLNEFFKPSVLNANKDANGAIKLVNYIQDPFGYAYGYSTAGAAAEEAYQESVRLSAGGKTPNRGKPVGYNPTFDLWSTGGSLRTASAADQGKWVKNW